MYVACKDLKTAKGLRKIGDQLPEVADWRHSVVLAHVNMGWIKWVGEGAKDKTPHSTVDSKKRAPAKNKQKKGFKKKAATAAPVEPPAST